MNQIRSELQVNWRRWLLGAGCLLLSLVGCASEPTPTAVSVVSPTVASPTPSPSATFTALPTAAPTATSSTTPSATASHTVTATSTPLATPSHTASPAYTPSSTSTPSLTPTETNTPSPPTATITPTKTITPTPTPTLTPTPLFTPTPLPTVAVSDDWVHLLLIGLDSTRNLRGQNTDVIIVAAINKATKQVSLLSIPRDLWVYIPTHGWNRINMAHKIGYRANYPGSGPGLLAETIKVNFGVPIDHWVRIDFEGFKRAVDEVGGVDMVVPCPVNLRYKPPDSEGEEEMILEPGVYHMDGDTVLRYVRTRRGGTDFDRARRQHRFLKEVWYQFKDANLISQIKALWSGLGDGFATDMNLLDVMALAPLALDLEPHHVRSRYIGANQTENWRTAEGWSVLLPRYDQIQKVVASLYGPPTSRDDKVAGEGARVRIWNGTYRRQLAKIAADQLRWYGIKVADTGLADNPNYKQTQIIIFNDKPKALELLVQLLNVQPENIIHQPDPNQPADIVQADLLVILGEDYDPCR